MEELLKISELLFKYGGTTIMAVLFIIIIFLDRKDRKQKELEEKEEKEREREERKAERETTTALLKQLSASSDNIAKSLSLLKTSIDNTNNEFKQHDERAIKNFQNIHEDLIILKERK